MKLYLAIPLLLAPVCPAQPVREPNIDKTITLNNKPPATGFDEFVKTIRYVASMPDVAGDEASSSVKLHGSAGDIALAEWIAQTLDRSEVSDYAVHEYIVPGPKDDVARVFYLTHAFTSLDVQELITVLRTVGHIRYIYQYTPSHALTVRGTSAEIRLAAWVIRELDQTPDAEKEGAHQFEWADPQVPLVRTFYLVHKSPRDIQETLTSLRGSAKIQRVFSHTTRGAIILAGTPAQVDDAAKLIAEKDRGAPKVTP